MRFGWSPQESSTRIRGGAKIAAVLSLLIYLFLYLREPLPILWNNVVVLAFPAVAAAVAASVATMIWLRYDREDAPRRIWRFFSIGLWLWTAAEVTYGYSYVVLEQDPPKGLPDVFWVAAYVFFAHALLIQYRLLANPDKRELWKRIVIVALALLGLLFLVDRALIVWLQAESELGAIVDAFYPVGDLCLALIAVWLLRHFRGGAFARPWLGLLVFSFADLLYAVIDSLGLYDQANNAWPAIFDTSYLAAYLVLGLGLLSQWVFLKYGLRSAPSEQ